MANERQHLIERFAEAGLKLEIANSPIVGAGNNDIFQLDIPRKLKGNTRIEWFRIWPGHETNTIVVQNIDKVRKQLILMVREEEREFTREEYVSEQQVVGLKVGGRLGGFHGGRILSIVEAPKYGHRKPSGTTYKVTVTQKTLVGKRHYLCGVDERQLFICQLPRGCATVDDAHRSLRRTELTLAEGKTRGRTIRQGEWFFVNLSQEDLDNLNAMLKKAPYMIRKKEAIGSGGHPHVADEIVRIGGNKLLHGYPVHEYEVYVRGSVTHVDHAPVRFAVWRRVIRNNEVGSPGANPDGGGRSMRGSPSRSNGSGGVLWVD